MYFVLSQFKFSIIPLLRIIILILSLYLAFVLEKSRPEIIL